jgi:undecaprenyl-diphosphatase
LEKLIEIDKKVLLFLNNLGSEKWDVFWLAITNKFYWAPFFAVLFYLLIKKIGWKQFGFFVLFLALLILVTDQFTNFVKYSFERLRPCNDPTLEGLLRIKEGWARKSFSYFSGHAANSMATTTFFYLIFRKYYRYSFFIFIFPLVFAYSRIYLGLHFPSDIFSGYIFGIFAGTLFYRIYKIMQPKYFPTN